MSLVVSLSRVREKAGLTGSSYDSKISNLISDWVPVLEFAIDPTFLNDTTNTGLQATLNLAATELITGEIISQLAREIGSTDGFAFGWLEVRSGIRDNADPSGLKQQGALRLSTFLKDRDMLVGSLGVYTGGSRSPA